MKSTLWERINYITDRKCIIGSSIYEYDISKANINMLRAYNLITDIEYNNFLVMDKSAREEVIGKRIRAESKKKDDNSDIKRSKTYKIISDGIRSAKKALMLSNEIDDSEVLRIANDAMYIERDYKLRKTRFKLEGSPSNHSVEFALKNHFSSMMQLGNVIVFFGTIEDNYIIDVKGINDVNMEYHEPFLGFLCDIISSMERADRNITLYTFNKFYEDYINRRLPLEFYREFNSESCYRIINSPIGTKFLDPMYSNLVDISYNINILRNLYSYILLYTI